MKRVWFVTGASRGLGREIVIAALEQGNQVVATARKPDRLDDLAASYRERLLVLPLDVSNAEAVTLTVDEAIKACGHLDVIVNNAGYANLVSIEDISLDDFHAQVDANLFGVVNVTKAVLPHLRQRGSGYIVNVSSVGGRVATPGLAAYQAAKWAVNGFSEVLAKEVGPLGIRVTAIEPGGMKTDWGGSSMAIPAVSAPYQQSVGTLASLFGTGAINPLGDPRKVADVIIKLADMEHPPVRLLLGSDALTSARIAASALAARDAQWEDLTRLTDRDDATPQDRDPLGEASRDPIALVRRFLDEVVNGGKLDAIDQLWTDDLVWHGGSMGEIHGLQAYKAHTAANAAGAFTGMRLSVKEIVAARDKVVVRFTNSGTQSGPFMGAPPSGKHAEWLGIGIYTVTGGKISEAWFGEDILGMMLQLGLVKLPV
jgi:NAD(P)-dependent dehydrogenase (short-subunit alcohol dehydrogenase family)/predicted ester cyclase